MSENPTFEELIERFAELAMDEAEQLVDAALVAIGVPNSTVNRRRGQLRRSRALKEAK